MLVLAKFNTTQAGVAGILPNGELFLEPFPSWDAAMTYLHALEKARGRRTKFDNAVNLDAYLYHAKLRAVKLEDLEEILEYVGGWADQEPAPAAAKKLTDLVARIRKQSKVPKPEVSLAGRKILDRRERTKLP